MPLIAGPTEIPHEYAHTSVIKETATALIGQRPEYAAAWLRSGGRRFESRRDRHLNKRLHPRQLFIVLYINFYKVNCVKTMSDTFAKVGASSKKPI